MKTIKERIEREREKLDRKIVKLNDFMIDTRFKKLSFAARNLLFEQERIMCQYSAVLKSRLALLETESTNV